MRIEWTWSKNFLFSLFFLFFQRVLSQTLKTTGFDKTPQTFFYFKDSQVVLWLDSASNTVFKSDNQGKEWNKIDEIGSKDALYLYEHPFDRKKAYVLGKGKRHWKTNDQGKTWEEFTTSVTATNIGPHLSFHASSPDYVLFTGKNCESSFWPLEDCHLETYYTLDNFKELKLVRGDVESCIWTISSVYFDHAPTNEIMCLLPSSKASKTLSFTNIDDSMVLIKSSDFFKTEKRIKFGTANRSEGVLGVMTVSQFVIAAVKSFQDKDEMSLFVSKDGEEWNEAIFPDFNIHEKSFTLVEGTGASLMVDVLAGDTSQFGSLYKSNSDGIYFTKVLENTNRNSKGFVDFERIRGVEGILVANVVANPDKVESGADSKEIRTKISFDDGASWNQMRSVRDVNGRYMDCKFKECSLHLHSVTSNHNYGQVSSSDSAIGVMMGVGNYGDHLLEYDECDTFLSTDYGISWKMVREGAHKYEFGDMGTLLVIVDDEKETDHIWWSKDRGGSWERFDLGMSIRARILTTDPESSTRNFLLIGGSIRSTDSKVQAIQLDFSNIFSRQCQFSAKSESESDFEKFVARDVTDGPDCLMGHEQIIYRRKADRECYVGLDYEDPMMELRSCPCTRHDYECDYNFRRSEDGSCIRVGPDLIPPGKCQSKDEVYLGSSGYRLIPGNTCVAHQKHPYDEPVERKCSERSKDITAPPTEEAHQQQDIPAEDQVLQNAIVFEGEIEQFLYFKDSESVLIRLANGELWRSNNLGFNWDSSIKEKINHIILHEFDNHRGYAFFADGIYSTKDQGATWTAIKVPQVPYALDFHPLESDWLLFTGQTNTDAGRVLETYISRDHGKSWSFISTDVGKCIFGRDSKFEIEKETVFCSSYHNNQIQLVKTKNWGKKFEVIFDNVVEFFVVEDFMIVATSKSGDLVAYVSTNGKSFTEAQFPPDQIINRNTFTILQSTTHSVLLNIFKTSDFGMAYGALYKSNEDGTLYHLSLDNTNGNEYGLVDFEKFQNLDGIILSNQVLNPDDLKNGKKIRTLISWDDGSQWQTIQPPKNSKCYGTDACSLHLHSRTTIYGMGAIYSSSGAPGLAMGVGNVGSHLTQYTEGDTYLTRDGGHTWSMIQKGEHHYEFGDQGSILVLVTDERPTNELMYSWDQGETWHTYRFSDKEIRVNLLTTDPKSSTLKFIIVGHTRDLMKSQVLVTVNFSNTQRPTCVIDKRNLEKSDFERWIAKDDDGDDACLLGKKTAYWRRKKDRSCVVRAQFQEPEVISEKCECRDVDFECDFGFWRNSDKECIFIDRHPDRPATCKDGLFKGRSGYRKNAKSNCSGGINLEKELVWPCEETGGVHANETDFGDRVVDYIYFTDTDRVIVRTLSGTIWLSENDGFKWSVLFNGEKVIAMHQNPYADQYAYFITEGKRHFATLDRAASFIEVYALLPPVNRLYGNILSFHNSNPKYLIYMGEQGCDADQPTKSDCRSTAFFSTDYGKHWLTIGSYMRKCMWGREGSMVDTNPESIFCEQYPVESGNQLSMLSRPVQLIYYGDYFKIEKSILFEEVAGIAAFGKFLIVAASENNKLKLYVSLNGVDFAPASFPSSFTIKPEAFTIMESTDSVWVHVSVNAYRGSEYGTIFNSNSNGTYFTTSLENVNRNEMGIVDFEKMQGIDGIAVANVVSNNYQVNKGDPKRLVTRKTSDAGGHWVPIMPPKKDSHGQPYRCQGEKDCYLHLHCYSERHNSRDLFSLSSAVGLMVAVGNVGPSLTSHRDGDMFLTRDAGKTWEEVEKGAHLWEFADQGALLILVKSDEPTNIVKYTTNEGLTWKTFEFTSRGEKVLVEDIITQPDGTSQKYVLFGLKKNGHTTAYSIDFSEIHPRKCVLDLKHPNDDDFELWSPEDTRGEKCLFGRETQYYRRIRESNCYIGEKLVQPREVIRHCSCTEEDYECDYNFVRDENNKCVLIPGYSPFIPKCDGKIDFYYKPTGYRKIAASTCEGGLELEKIDTEQVWCPNTGHSFLKWIMILSGIPIGAAAVLFVLRYRRNVRLGPIRLQDNTEVRSGVLPNRLIANIVAAAFVIPIAILGFISRVRLPNFSLSSLRSRRSSGFNYSQLDQNEYADVLLEDYDGSEEQFSNDIDGYEDADEL